MLLISAFAGNPNALELWKLYLPIILSLSLTLYVCPVHTTLHYSLVPNNEITGENTAYTMSYTKPLFGEFSHFRRRNEFKIGVAIKSISTTSTTTIYLCLCRRKRTLKLDISSFVARDTCKMHEGVTLEGIPRERYPSRMCLLPSNGKPCVPSANLFYLF